MRDVDRKAERNGRSAAGISGGKADGSRSAGGTVSGRIDAMPAHSTHRE